MKSVETISERFYQQSQSWIYDRIVSWDNLSESKARIRVEIRRNAYDDQSYIHGFVYSLTSMQWNLLVTKPIQQALCRDVSYTNSNPNKTLFVCDAEAVWHPQ